MRIPIIGGASEALVSEENGVLVAPRYKPTANMTTREWIEDKAQQGLRVEHIAKEQHEHDLADAELFMLHGATGWELLVAVKEG